MAISRPSTGKDGVPTPFRVPLRVRSIILDRCERSAQRRVTARRAKSRIPVDATKASRRRGIALAGSALGHAAIAVVLVGLSNERSLPRTADRTPAPTHVTAVRFTPISPKPLVESKPTPPGDAAAPGSQSASRRPRAARAAGHHDASNENETETTASNTPSAPAGGEGPVAVAPNAAGLARDLSTVDLDLHGTASRDAPVVIGNAPTAGARVSPGGSAGSLESSGEGTYLHRDTHFYAHVGYDGSVEFEGHGRKLGIGPDDDHRTISGKIPFDVTDAVLGATGNDPYGYEKKKFMAATQGLRFAMYDRACKEQLASAVLDMRPQLETIWKNERLSASQRRLLIFQLWDQCAENGPPDVKRTTEQIRAIIVDFIQERIPRSSQYAYSDADLASLNRSRRSSERFAPYE